MTDLFCMLILGPIFIATGEIEGLPMMALIFLGVISGMILLGFLIMLVIFGNRSHAKFILFTAPRRPMMGPGRLLKQRRIKKLNIIGSAIRNDIKLPMIDTQDIADYAAERLDKRDFPAQSIVHLLGQRDLSMEEANRVIGRLIDKPELTYVQFPYDETERTLTGMGFSQDTVRLSTEMTNSFNEGLIRPQRTPQNSTETPIEEFGKVFRKLVYDL